MKTEPAANVDEYIAGFPPDVQGMLNTVRATVRAAAPEAEETIKYAMPAYVLDGNLVYFAAFKHHVGFYGTSTGNGALTEEMAPYAEPKGSLKFPFGEPVPTALLTRIVEVRMRENREKAQAKAKKR